MKKISLGLCALLLFLGGGAEAARRGQQRGGVSQEQLALAGRINTAITRTREITLPEGISDDDVSPLRKMMETHRDSLKRRDKR